MNIEGFKLMSDVTEESVEWLWCSYIPLGEFTILEGHPATNKSSLMHALAACLTKGIAMPCVPPKRGRKRKGGALFLIAEDSVAKTVRGRLLQPMLTWRRSVCWKMSSSPMICCESRRPSLRFTPSWSWWIRSTIF